MRDPQQNSPAISTYPYTLQEFVFLFTLASYTSPSLYAVIDTLANLLDDPGTLIHNKEK